MNSVTDALGQTEHYRYDKKGQLLEKVDKEGYLTKYGYTHRGDVEQIRYADGREVKLSYNPLRQLTEMEDWLGITKIENDALGRAEKVTYPDGKSVSYTYGKTGERTSITYPDGRTIHYGFDENLRLSELKDGAPLRRYSYDAFGNRINLLEVRKTTAYTYNLISRKIIHRLSLIDLVNPHKYWIYLHFSLYITVYKWYNKTINYTQESE